MTIGAFLRGLLNIRFELSEIKCTDQLLADSLRRVERIMQRSTHHVDDLPDTSIRHDVS